MTTRRPPNSSGFELEATTARLRQSREELRKRRSEFLEQTAAAVPQFAGQTQLHPSPAGTRRDAAPNTERSSFFESDDDMPEASSSHAAQRRSVTFVKSSEDSRHVNSGGLRNTLGGHGGGGEMKTSGHRVERSSLAPGSSRGSNVSRGTTATSAHGDSDAKGLDARSASTKYDADSVSMSAPQSKRTSLEFHSDSGSNFSEENHRPSASGLSTSSKHEARPGHASSGRRTLLEQDSDAGSILDGGSRRPSVSSAIASAGHEAQAGVLPLQRRTLLDSDGGSSLGIGSRRPSASSAIASANHEAHAGVAPLQRRTLTLLEHDSDAGSAHSGGSRRPSASSVNASASHGMRALSEQSLSISQPMMDSIPTEWFRTVESEHSRATVLRADSLTPTARDKKERDAIAQATDPSSRLQQIEHIVVAGAGGVGGSYDHEGTEQVHQNGGSVLEVSNATTFEPGLHKHRGPPDPKIESADGSRRFSSLRLNNAIESIPSVVVREVEPEKDATGQRHRKHGEIELDADGVAIEDSPLSVSDGATVNQWLKIEPAVPRRSDRRWSRCSDFTAVSAIADEACLDAAVRDASAGVLGETLKTRSTQGIQTEGEVVTALMSDKQKSKLEVVHEAALVFARVGRGLYNFSCELPEDYLHAQLASFFCLDMILVQQLLCLLAWKTEHARLKSKRQKEMLAERVEESGSKQQNLQMLMFAFDNWRHYIRRQLEEAQARQRTENELADIRAKQLLSLMVKESRHAEENILQIAQNCFSTWACSIRLTSADVKKGIEENAARYEVHISDLMEKLAELQAQSSEKETQVEDLVMSKTLTFEEDKSKYREHIKTLEDKITMLEEHLQELDEQEGEMAAEAKSREFKLQSQAVNRQLLKLAQELQRQCLVAWYICLRPQKREVQRQMEEYEKQRTEEAACYERQIQVLQDHFEKLQMRLEEMELRDASDDDYVRRLESDKMGLEDRIEEATSQMEMLHSNLSTLKRDARLRRRQLAEFIESSSNKRSLTKVKIPQYCFRAWHEHARKCKIILRGTIMLWSSRPDHLLVHALELWYEVAINCLGDIPYHRVPEGAMYEAPLVDEYFNEASTKLEHDFAAERARHVTSLNEAAASTMRIQIMWPIFLPWKMFAVYMRTRRLKSEYQKEIEAMCDQYAIEEELFKKRDAGKKASQNAIAQFRTMELDRLKRRYQDRVRLLSNMGCVSSPNDDSFQVFEDLDPDHGGIAKWASAAKNSLRNLMKRRTELDENRVLADRSISFVTLAVNGNISLEDVDLLSTCANVWHHHARASIVLRQRKKLHQDLVEYVRRLADFPWDAPQKAGRRHELSPRTHALEESAVSQLQRHRNMVRKRHLDHVKELRSPLDNAQKPREGRFLSFDGSKKTAEGIYGQIDDELTVMVNRDRMQLCFGAWHSSVFITASSRIAEQIHLRHSTEMKRACDEYAEGLERMENSCSWMMIPPIHRVEHLGFFCLWLAFFHRSRRRNMPPHDYFRAELQSYWRRKLLIQCWTTWSQMVLVSRTNRLRAQLTSEYGEEMRFIVRQRDEDMTQLLHIELDSWACTAERLGAQMRARLLEARTKYQVQSRAAKRLDWRYEDASESFDSRLREELQCRCLIAWKAYVPTARARNLREQARSVAERDHAWHTQRIGKLLDDHPLLEKSGWSMEAVDNVLSSYKALAPGESRTSLVVMKSLDFNEDLSLEVKRYFVICWCRVVKHLQQHTHSTLAKHYEEIHAECEAGLGKIVADRRTYQCFQAWQVDSVGEKISRRLRELEQSLERDRDVAHSSFIVKGERAFADGDARKILCLFFWRLTSRKVQIEKLLRHDREKHEDAVAQLRRRHEEELSCVRVHIETVGAAKQVFEETEWRTVAVRNMKTEVRQCLQAQRKELEETRRQREQGLAEIANAKSEASELMMQMEKLGQVVGSLEHQNQMLRQAEDARRKDAMLEEAALTNEVVDEDLEVIDVSLTSPTSEDHLAGISTGPVNNRAARDAAAEAAAAALRAKHEAECRAAEAEQRAVESARKVAELENLLRLQSPASPVRKPVSPVGITSEPMPEPGAPPQQLDALTALVDELQAENKQLHDRVMQRSLVENEQWMDAMVQLVEELRRENAELHAKTLSWRPPRSQREASNRNRRQRSTGCRASTGRDHSRGHGEYR